MFSLKSELQTSNAVGTPSLIYFDISKEASLCFNIKRQMSSAQTNKNLTERQRNEQPNARKANERLNTT